MTRYGSRGNNPGTVTNTRVPGTGKVGIIWAEYFIHYLVWMKKGVITSAK